MHDRPPLAAATERLCRALGVASDDLRRTTAAFWADRGAQLHAVLEGSLDVFAVERAGDEPAGARHHLFRVEAGAVLPNVERPPGRLGILVVPAPGACHAPIAADAATPPAADAECQAALAEAIARLVLAVGDGLVHALPPTHYRPLAAGERAELPAGTSIAGVERLLWLRLEAGALRAFGRADVALAAPALLPLCSRAWAEAAPDASGRDAALVAESGDTVAPAAAWPALRVWLARMYDLAEADLAAETVREAGRLDRKAAHTGALLHDALQRFADTAATAGKAVDESATGGAAAVDGQGGDAALLAACRLVGKATGFEVAAPRHPRLTALLERAEEIAVASKARSRRVVLRDDWWNGDNGPLLGVLAADDPAAKRPVALLPAPGGGYRLHDPTGGPARAVTAAVAAELEAFALSFYRTFPPRALKPADMLRFGAFGLRRDFAAVLLAGALAGLLGMATPMVTGRLIDTVIPSAVKTDILALTAVLFAAAMASALFGLARAVAMLRVESRMDNALQAAVLDRVLALPAEFFRRYSAGDLAVRINGINTMRHALSGAVMGTLLSSTFSFFSIALLFYYNAKLALAALGLIGVALLTTLALGYLKLRCERELAELGGRISGMVFQYLTGIVKLRVCVAEARAFANWAALHTRLRSLTMRTTRLSNIEQTFYAGYGVIINAVLFAVVGMVVLKDAQAKFSTGEFIAFNSAFGTVFSAMIELSETVLGLLKLVPLYERTRPILEAPPEVGAGRIVPGELSGDIEVAQLGFGYGDGPQVLDNVSFRLRPGEFVAIVGPSGSGKSTLLRLLMGFEQPRAGSVCYDSHNLLDLDVNAVRRQFGVVLQSGQLMSGDIFANIAGATAATLDQVWEAARLCGLEEDINNMPMGMHTVISEGSSTLSGGQRQRILIARAIVAKPRILFFDEATSALDNRTQSIVSESLERLKATRLVIAHRLSTVVKADRILVMQDGRIAQSGRYEELLAQPGLFAELARRQVA